MPRLRRHHGPTAVKLWWRDLVLGDAVFDVARAVVRDAYRVAKVPICLWKSTKIAPRGMIQTALRRL
jgi:hypothetical protein